MIIAAMLSTIKNLISKNADRMLNRYLINTRPHNDIETSQQTGNRLETY